MIKFFRKIRQDLLSKGKTGKYFKYAIGEIILVVIGILIALQINNWNENRKAKEAELTLYTRIVNDLKVDKEKLEIIVDKLKIFRKIQIQVFRESIGKATYDENIEYIQLRWGERFNPVVKENNNLAISTISSDSIRNQINQYFKQEARTIEALELSNKLRREKLRDFLTKNGVLNTSALYDVKDFGFDSLYHLDFINYDKLKEQYGSIELDQILAELRIEMSWTLTKVLELIEENENLILTLESK